MSLYKRKDSPNWWVKLPPIPGEGGKPLQISTGTASKRDAQAFHDRLKVERWEQARLGVKPRRKWEDAVAKFLEETSHKRTHKQDQAMLAWLTPELGGKWLDEIDRAQIDRIKAKRARIASKARANRYLALLRSILRKACHEWEWIDHIPKMTLFRENNGRIRALTREEFWRLHRELPPHLADMALFAVSTGLRAANVRLLQWAWVDMPRRHMRIPADQFKNGEAHGVPLNQTAMDILNRRDGLNAKYVFTFNAKPVEQISTRAWRAALARAGIEDFHWHDLRHTWATWQRQAGTPTHELQRLGGWKSLVMVERYAHVAPEGLRVAADRLDNVLGYTAAT
ncbi:site-specific integrase [Corticibacter populi]|uniref:Site-specific integrase n=1 Tax=Corticibacter populi TaxID=1550736 RepID=A0A3M6R077_9BURK|nr:site-specific integrase [Corticibacter populi]RMX08650.1 site-specific integrase [Corticibacter populi]RZS35982.1 site-specific recombinase XerD [Corticibacter populi]